MPKSSTPVLKRPAFWAFLSAGVAFAAVYAVQGVTDPVLLLDFVKAALVLLGIGAVTKLGYDKLQESKSE